MADKYTVFISYSWSTPRHEDWVINLAERLMADGVDVIIDKWNLKEGHDKYTFMESMVTSTDVNKVLLILDKKYAEKANERSGGVGTETQIISPQIYSNVSQEKFIPIVVERDENGAEFMPVFLESRIYIDLSNSDHFEVNYEKLLRNIYQRPAYIKPKLGKAPTYLFADDVTSHRTATISRSFETQYEKNPQKANSIIKDFLDEFFESLKSYSITFSSRNDIEAGKQVVDSLNSYLVLRNDFISFYTQISKPEITFDIDILLKFFEKLPALRRPLDGRGSWANAEFDNFKFIIHELFLYSIAIGLKNESYKLLEEIFYSSYFLKDSYETYPQPYRFDCFYYHIEVFNRYYNQTYSQNFLSPMADFIIKRLPNEITKDQMVDADLLTYYIAEINNLRWFPITYVYRTGHGFNLFDRMISQRHFDKMKALFNVDTIQAMKDLLISLKANERAGHRVGYSNSYDSVTPLYKLINLETIGSVR